MLMRRPMSVSYTHLDVYKRQVVTTYHPLKLSDRNANDKHRGKVLETSGDYSSLKCHYESSQETCCERTLRSEITAK